MGQSLRRLAPEIDLETSIPFEPATEVASFQLWPSPEEEEEENRSPVRNFPDLSRLPPEIALTVLSNLNATDLCLAACVWQQLASDEILWEGLCKEEWPETSVYHLENRRPQDLPMRKVYLQLDEGTLTFNSDPTKGMHYFFEHGLVQNQPMSIAEFFHHTTKLNKGQMRRYLQGREDVVACMIELQNYKNDFLPNALRKCFSKLEAPNDRGNYLQQLLDAFSRRFCQCNPQLGYSTDTVYVMCFSLILLSVDLTSPHVKNKMSKREFIRNTRNAILQLSRNQDDLFGEMYDNVFLRGHVSDAAADGKSPQNAQQQFIPGYLALFL